MGINLKWTLTTQMIENDQVHAKAQKGGNNVRI